MNDTERPASTTLASVERKLAAILSADVAGYSRLMGEDEVGTLRILTAHRAVMDPLISQHRGRIVGTAGDSVLAEFASAVDAVQCAVEIQQSLRANNAELPIPRRMEFRIGINVGDVVVEGEQIYGDGVNVAARLQGLADAGGLFIAGTVYDQIENKLTLHYEYLGEQAVKNIAKPVRVYRVQMSETDGVETPQRDVSTLHLPEQAQALSLPDKPSIAVLPFTNMSSDPEQEYFSDGMTEDLITDLSKLSALFVIARNSVFTYKGKAVQVEQVGRELGVQYVLEGSVRKAGGRVRITAQLVDATTGHHLWADRYDGELKDIFTLQDTVTRKIVSTLKLQLTLWEQGWQVRKRTDNPEAYDYYLRGMEHFYRLTKEAQIQARRMYERAIELDPTYAAAYTFLGFTYHWEWVSQWSQDPQALEQALALAQKALALDDSLPEAHRLLGIVYLRKEQYERAIAEIERAIALAPNDVGGYVTLGAILVPAGRPREAIEWAEKAIRLNPRDPVLPLYILGSAYRLMGRHEEAITAQKKALARNPNFGLAHAELAVVYSELGREDEAKAEMAEVLKASPSYSLAVARQRLSYKDPAELERHLNALRKAGLK